MKKGAKGNQAPIVKEYEEMEKTRQPYIDRARAYSKLSIPYIYPEEGVSGSQQVSHGHQSLGSECVNTFSNHFVNTLFPIGAPFFSIEVDEFELDKDEMKAYEKNKPKLLTMYVQITLRAMKLFNKMAFRDRLVMYAKHLVISGNACLVMLKDRVKVISLEKYVVKRDCSGLWIKGIIKEKYDKTTLTDEVRELVDSNRGHSTEEEVTIFTVYRRLSSDRISVKQITDLGVEIMNEEVDENKVSVVFGRWNVIDGEDYGRGHCEDYAGDLHMYNFLAEYEAKGAATMMDVKYLVRPGSITDLNKLNESAPGTYVRGNKDDIVPLELAKFSDGRLIKEVMDEYKARLSSAFLLFRGVVRDSERTTKYELQKSVEDLESAKAGVYANQSAELQTPIAGFILDAYNPKLMENGFSPVIDTGLAAIGKANDLERLRRYTELMAYPATWTPEAQQKLDIDKYDAYCANLVSLDTSLFFKSAEQMDTEDSNQIDSETANSLGAGISQGVGKAVGEQLINQG